MYQEFDRPLVEFNLSGNRFRVQNSVDPYEALYGVPEKEHEKAQGIFEYRMLHSMTDKMISMFLEMKFPIWKTTFSNPMERHRTQYDIEGYAFTPTEFINMLIEWDHMDPADRAVALHKLTSWERKKNIEIIELGRKSVPITHDQVRMYTP